MAVVCLTTAALSFANLSDVLPDASTSAVSVSLGPARAVVFDGRGSLLTYATVTGGGCQTGRSCDSSRTTRGEISYLRQWLAPSQKMASFLHGYAAQRGFGPVVFFAVQDPFFNTNTVDLAYQLAFAQDLPTGLLRTPAEAGATASEQLADPAFWRPNFVITGPPSAIAAARAFSPLLSETAAIAAVKAEGFAPVAQILLPDDRVMTVWWEARGPVINEQA